MKVSFFLRAFMGVATCFLVACGGSNDSNHATDVTFMNSDPSVLNVGQGTVLSVGLSFSAGDTFVDNERLNVVVRVPNGLSFKPDTAEIKRPIDDQSITPSGITSCPDGSTFVSFSLNQSDLLLATNPSGDTDAEIRFELTEISAQGDALVTASTSENGVPFSCALPFDSQSSVVVVLR